MPSKVGNDKASSTTRKRIRIRIGQVKTSALLDPLEWEDFKRICKAEGASMSRVLSGMIQMFNASYEHGFRLIKMGKVFVMPLMCIRIEVPGHKRFRRKNPNGAPVLTECLAVQALVSAYNAIKRYRLEL